MFRYIYSFVLLCMPLIGCATSKNAENQGDQGDLVAYEVLAAERYGEAEAVAYTPNEPESHILVTYQQKPSAKQPHPVTSYFVFDLIEEQIVVEEKGFAGEVAWHDAHHLKVKYIPGIVTRQEDEASSSHSYLVDVRIGKRVTEKGLKH